MIKNILAFFDTLFKTIFNRNIRSKTKSAIANTKIIQENFISDKAIENHCNCKIEVLNAGTLDSARMLKNECSHVCVLNFANAVICGGGVILGANAQEEYLCRNTNLYRCLFSYKAFPYYIHNICLYLRNLWNITSFLSSDRLVYSKSVSVLKIDNKETEAFEIDVITAAAPCWYLKPSQKKYDKITKIYQSRIKNILEAAYENDADGIVLGAFGCGAFNNPPELVAEVFREILNDNRYGNMFKNIVFAIKGKNDNYRIFKEILVGGK